MLNPSYVHKTAKLGRFCELFILEIKMILFGDFQLWVYLIKFNFINNNFRNSVHEYLEVHGAKITDFCRFELGK
jgi:translation elongation factor EF-Ts